jgi:hypothetical protein
LLAGLYLRRFALRRRPRVATFVSIGVASASCGKVGYDAQGLEPHEASVEFDSSPPPVDAQRDTSGSVFGDGDGPDGSGAPVSFAVGSFVKSGIVGAQTVAHGLGQAPKALLLFTAGEAAAGPSADYMYAFGVSDGPGSSRSVANASRSGAVPANATRRMALKAISIAGWGEVTLAEADLASWDAATFTLAWSTNNPDSYALHYVAIGGASVSAKVVSWQTPTAPGPRPVAGFGFRPDTVFNFYSGALFVNAPPTSQANGALGMGMFDGAGSQCAFHVAVVDGANPTRTAHALRTDASLYMFSERPSPVVTKQAAVASMDGDGFTLDFMTAETSPSQVFSLALRGVKAKVGAYAKATSAAPLVQSVTGVGFKPGLVLLASVDDIAQSSGVSQPNANLMTGASDGKSQASAAIEDIDNVAPSKASGADDSTRVFDELRSPSAGVGDAQATLASLDPDGFSLGWTATDSSATRICYWALGSP